MFLATLVTDLMPEQAEALRPACPHPSRRSPPPGTTRRGIGRSIGRYQLEAALQSAHVYRCRTGHANGDAVLQIYDALFAITGSPVVTINRALAIAELQGAQAALDAMPDAADAANVRIPSPTGRHARNYRSEQARTWTLATRTKWQSAWHATLRSAAF